MPPTPHRTSRRRAPLALSLTCALLGLSATALDAAWLPTGGGPYNGNSTGNPNWDLTQAGRVWVFNSPLTTNQTVLLSGTAAGSTRDQFLFFNDSGFDYLLESSSSTETILRSAFGLRLKESDQEYSVSIGSEDAPITVRVDSDNTGRFDIGRNATLYTQKIEGTPAFAGTYFGISKNGEGTLVMRGSNSYVGATRLSQGKMTLDFGNSSNTTDIISTSNTGTAPRNFMLYGGTFQINGRGDGVAVSQTFEKTELDGFSGHANIVLNSNDGGISLALGNFFRRSGSSVNFSINSPDSEVLFSSADTQSVKVDNGVLTGRLTATQPLAAFATVNGSTWATAEPVAEGSTTMRVRGLLDSEYETSTNSANWGTSNYATQKNVSIDGTNVQVSTAAYANTFRLQNGASLEIASGQTLTISRGGILVTGNGAGGSISGGTLNANASQRELLVFQNNTTNAFTISSALTNIGITKTGAGKLIVEAGPGGNISTFTTSMTEGILEVSNINALGTGILRFAGGTLRYVGNGGTFSNALSVTPAGGYLDSSGTGGALILSSTSNTNGPAPAVTPARLTLTGSNQEDNTLASQFGPGVNQSLELIKEGIGTWVLSSMTSGNLIDTTIREGTLKVVKLADWQSASSIGRAGHYDADGQGYSLVINGGRLEYIGAGDSTNRLFTIGSNGATVAASGSGVLNFTNTADVLFGAWGESRSLTLSGTNTGNNTFASRLTDNLTAATSLTKTEGGTWIITGANTYTGATTVNDGILRLSGNGTLGAANSALNIEGGTVDLGGKAINKTNDVIVAGRLINGSIHRTGGQIEVRSGEISAQLSGDGDLVKTTSGKATLSSFNSLDGNLEVRAGTLELASGFTAAYWGNTIVRSSGTLLVNYEGFDKGAMVESGGTFGGHATLSYWDNSSDITLANGARLAPGSQTVSGGITQVIGVLDASQVSLNFTGNAALDIDLNSAGSGTAGVNWDQLVAGNVNSTSGFELTLNLTSRGADGSHSIIAGWDASQEYTWTSVILFDSSYSGEGNTPFDIDQFLINQSSFLNASGTFFVTFNADYTGIDLHYAAIPEPSTLVLLLGSLGGYLILHRRPFRVKNRSAVS